MTRFANAGATCDSAETVAHLGHAGAKSSKSARRTFAPGDRAQTRERMGHQPGPAEAAPDLKRLFHERRRLVQASGHAGKHARRVQSPRSPARAALRVLSPHGPEQVIPRLSEQALATPEGSHRAREAEGVLTAARPALLPLHPTVAVQRRRGEKR